MYSFVETHFIVMPNNMCLCATAMSKTDSGNIKNRAVTELVTNKTIFNKVLFKTMHTKGGIKYNWV